MFSHAVKYISGKASDIKNRTVIKVNVSLPQTVRDPGVDRAE